MSEDSKNVVAVFPSEEMGAGDPKLGKTLAKNFIYALAQQENPPQVMLFYNSGARLTCEGSPALEDLKGLADRGVEIFTCGTCLDFYELTDKLAVGERGNMQGIARYMVEADHVVQP
ncbi:MAG: sulfurtransferase-like selenium metabolism protein YedF [Coriobacteriia bacterium]|nr:sulfurtransferase-like selenium metabolism protein YedF [Coriobacteriia bacterium]